MTKDRFGTPLDDWPACLYCGHPLGIWPGDRYFCQNINCPLHYMPAEWTVEIEKDGVRAVTLANEIENAVSKGWDIVGYGVGYGDDE